ncbi:MAG: BLUF domain-containing protein [Magnetococcales bacterium]|nr:BLUF domain-containing protein [Magnetococcales bacterium]
MIIRLTYYSKSIRPLLPSDIEQIFRVSHHNNKILNITGFLLYSNNVFLQCLEGPREAVNQLYQKIYKDDRHDDCNIVLISEEKERIFGPWSMGGLPPEELVKLEVLERISPELFRGEEILNLLIKASKILSHA